MRNDVPVNAKPMLAGDFAYDLWHSQSENPLQEYLTAWKHGDFDHSPEFVSAVIGCYKRMLERCLDGRYGKIRDR